MAAPPTRAKITGPISPKIRSHVDSAPLEFEAEIQVLPAPSVGAEVGAARHLDGGSVAGAIDENTVQASSRHDQPCQRVEE